MDDLQKQIEIEAYAIYEARCKYGLSGTREGDWADAERKIRTKNIDDILGTSLIYNRIKDLM